MLLCCTTLAWVGATSAAAPPVRLGGSWAGSYTLRAVDDLTITVAGGRGAVALGPGHAAVQTVRVSRRGARVRFTVPGRPAIAFDGRLSRGRLAGTVRQGTLRGRFALRRGTAPHLLARGFFSLAGRLLAVVDDEFSGIPRLVDVERGELRGLFRRGGRFDIGAGFATRDPVVGTAAIDARGATLPDGRASRLPLRQLEVRFPSGNASLAGTLTLPAGAGPHPAVAFVHGSGTTRRSYLADYHALLLRAGVAVLAYDKRGVGQSGGGFPGELATDTTIDVLATDAQAAARFLAQQPEIDRARVGLIGHSQGGWIVPLAASRESAIRFVVALAGPVTTQGETDLFADLRETGATEEQALADVRAQGPSGFDPLPAIRALRVPALWLFGRADPVVPAVLCLERLDSMLREPGRDFTTAVFAGANHALLVPAPDSFAPGLLDTLRAWLRARNLGG